jgi:hypothetical protein
MEDVSEEDIQAKFMEAFRFDEKDLATNREGELSPKQLQQMRRHHRHIFHLKPGNSSRGFPVYFSQFQTRNEDATTCSCWLHLASMCIDWFGVSLAILASPQIGNCNLSSWQG